MLGLWLIVGLGVLAWIIEMPRRQATAMIAGAWLGIVALHAIAPASGLAAQDRAGDPRSVKRQAQRAVRGRDGHSINDG